MGRTADRAGGVLLTWRLQRAAADSSGLQRLEDAARCAVAVDGVKQLDSRVTKESIVVKCTPLSEATGASSRAAGEVPSSRHLSSNDTESADGTQTQRQGSLIVTFSSGF